MATRKTTRKVVTLSVGTIELVDFWTGRVDGFRVVVHDRKRFRTLIAKHAKQHLRLRAIKLGR